MILPLHELAGCAQDILSICAIGDAIEDDLGIGAMRDQMHGVDVLTLADDVSHLLPRVMLAVELDDLDSGTDTSDQGVLMGHGAVDEEDFVGGGCCVCRGVEIVGARGKEVAGRRTEVIAGDDDRAGDGVVPLTPTPLPNGERGFSLCHGLGLYVGLGVGVTGWLLVAVGGGAVRVGTRGSGGLGGCRGGRDIWHRNIDHGDIGDGWNQRRCLVVGIGHHGLGSRDSSRAIEHEARLELEHL